MHKNRINRVHHFKRGGISGKVQELIEENKTKEFQLTYQEQGNLYLIKGYGEQKTGGYSIRIEDVSLWENAIHVQTMLIGPKEENLKTNRPIRIWLFGWNTRMNRLFLSKVKAEMIKKE